jgi:hypothetical protein
MIFSFSIYLAAFCVSAAGFRSGSNNHRFHEQLLLPAVMATSYNFRRRSRPEEFPERKSVAGIDDAGGFATQSPSQR